jgi:hypothetical protein
LAKLVLQQDSKRDKRRDGSFDLSREAVPAAGQAPGTPGQDEANFCAHPQHRSAINTAEEPWRVGACDLLVSTLHAGDTKLDAGGSNPCDRIAPAEERADR